MVPTQHRVAEIQARLTLAMMGPLVGKLDLVERLVHGGRVPLEVETIMLQFDRGLKLTSSAEHSLWQGKLRL